MNKQTGPGNGGACLEARPCIQTHDVGRGCEAWGGRERVRDDLWRSRDDRSPHGAQEQQHIRPSYLIMSWEGEKKKKKKNPTQAEHTLAHTVRTAVFP